MSCPINNIVFYYLYRDPANFKQYGCAIFPNPDNREAASITASIRMHLTDSGRRGDFARADGEYN